MANKIWSCVGIIFLAVVMVLVCLRFTRAYGGTMIDEMATWEKVKVVYVNETPFSPPTIKLILKNPNVGDVVFAIVDINPYCVPSYVLVGKDLRMFRLDEPEYKEIELSQELKEVIWIFLIGIGIANI